ncbi:MAG: DUF2029 domain-containing protein [Ktedonobacteraceae bacterium]|nr:DUF2029 domain-containing protein [Ktedonobacteraceae bacterium]
MELQSVGTWIRRSRKDGKQITYQWMRFFFTEHVSQDNRSLLELQRRATWIALALILQSLNELTYASVVPLIPYADALIPPALILSSFFAMWRAIRPASPKEQAQIALQWPATWQRIVLILALLLTIPGGILLGRGLAMSLLPPQFSNDGTSLDTNAAILLLQGRNPYTDSNLAELARRFPIQPNWTTPLRQGQFANRLDYPSMAELQSVLDTSLKAGHLPEFEARVSYPALSFLTLVPFVAVGNYNVLPFYLVSYLLIIAIAWKVVHPPLRPWVVVLSLANVPMWSSAVGGNLDVFYTLLLIPAWLLRDRRWLSAILLGLALASKQPSWFFLPFYLLMVYRHYGLKETFARATVAGGLALAINLPFILWNPQAWLAGVLAPLADPMFPLGVGLISLSTSHLLPFLPQQIYTVLLGSVLLLMLAWYWRICREHPEAAMLLAIIPLFFSWRSLPSYFYCSAFPLFILLTAQGKSQLVSEMPVARPHKRSGTLDINMSAGTS